jgi:hypothetical protein
LSEEACFGAYLVFFASGSSNHFGHRQEARYTGYSLRRGGATAYFVQTGSMKKTLLCGLWTVSSMAMLYVLYALAQAGEFQLEKSQRVDLKALSLEISILFVGIKHMQSVLCMSFT